MLNLERIRNFFNNSLFDFSLCFVILLPDDIYERRSGKIDQNLNFVARVEKSISFIFFVHR